MAGVAFAVEGDGVGVTTESYAASALYTTLASLSGALRRIKTARAARIRLKPAGKPYYRSLEHGLHLGYRKPLSGPGRWIARYYIGNQKYETEKIAAADDF